MTQTKRPASPPLGTTLSVDTSRWPRVLLTYAGKPTDQQVSDHLREIEDRVLARRQPFVQVIDQRRGEPPNPMQRALIADHQSKMDGLYRSHCLGEAYVVSPETRGAMVAVFWMARPPYPYAFVETLGEGLAWAEHRLSEAAR